MQKTAGEIMLTWRVGAAASPAADQAMAEYYLAGTLKPALAPAVFSDR